MKQIEITVPACLKMHFAKRMKRKCKITGKFKMQKVTAWHNVLLNLNRYRNWNHYFSGSVKKKFSEVIFEQMQSIPKMEKIVQIEYTLLNPTDHSRDKNNVCCIVDKFFLDALQEYKKIVDDSDEIVGDTVFKVPEKIEGSIEDIAVRIKILYI